MSTAVGQYFKNRTNLVLHKISTGVGQLSETAGQKSEKNSMFERQNCGHFSDKLLTRLSEFSNSG
jgi:hypothetical protein